MAMKSLGKVVVTTSGTIVQTTTTHTSANGFIVQAWPTNTGKIWVGNSVMNRTNGTGVFGYVAVPSTTSSPSFSSTIVGAPEGFDMKDIYLDADVNGEAAIVSYNEQ